MNLSFRNMCKLRPILRKWLYNEDDAESADSQSVVSAVGRKKRTSIDALARRVLEEHFISDCKPCHETLVRLADTLGMSRNVIRVWFCNRQVQLVYL